NIHRIIAAFYDGRIDQIYVEHVGQHVEKGQPLAAIYSPELLTLFGNIKTRCGVETQRWQETRRSASFRGAIWVGS
ncbi:MAG: efflux RND transporter periplasmic adaptor subunit, partial [Terrimicrobium sp.]